MIETRQSHYYDEFADDWDSEPATAKQIRQMKRWKLIVISGLTKRAAYLMLNAEDRSRRAKRRARGKASK